MTPDEELALVRKALTCGLSNCVEWINVKEAHRVRSNPANQGLTPEGVKRRLLDFVRKNPDAVEQRREQRRDDYPRDFWYRVKVPIEGFPRGLFVEIVLMDEDPDVPYVGLVSAHP